MANPDPLALLDLDDMAELTKTKADWIRRLCQKRLVEYTRVANEIRMTRDQFAALLRDHAVPVSDVAVPTRDEVAAQRSNRRLQAAS